MLEFKEVLSRPLVATALGFAIAKHGDQKYGQDPYSVHLLRVAEIVYTVGKPNGWWLDHVLAAALLHDVLEDTQTTEEELLGIFGKEVLAIVKACTKTETDLCRKCAFRRTVKALKTTDWALPVKLADRLANMQKSNAEQSPQQKMYVREYAEFKGQLWADESYPEFWYHLDKAFEEGTGRGR